jgi:hypothetical protein
VESWRQLTIGGQHWILSIVNLAQRRPGTGKSFVLD